MVDPAEDQHVRQLPIGRRQRFDALPRVDDHRLKPGDGDEGDLPGICAAEPCRQERHPGKNRDLAKGQQAWADNPLRCSRKAKPRPSSRPADAPIAKPVMFRLRLSLISKASV
ncbi:hypothetical protein BMJ23_00010 [Sinorhizobium medicae]|nr:hypothetical protein BMJ23_00010 [Sinorhizobium medicae]